MSRNFRIRAGDYLLAIATVGVGLLIRVPFWGVLGTNVPFLTFFPAVMLSAWRGGFGPGLLSTVLSALVALYFFVKPIGSIALTGTADAVAVALFLGVGAFISLLTDRLHKSESNERRSRLLTEQTLIGIGDAVIATDTAGAVTFMNKVAEKLTGWSIEDVKNRPHEEIFRIVREGSDKPVESPVVRVLREGIVQGLANHTELVTRDGKRTPIDDSGAPIRDEKGEIVGAVLVFRDVGPRRREEREAIAAKERLNFALEAGGGIGTWDWDVTSDRLYADERFARLFSVDREVAAAGMPLSAYTASLHPDDRRRVEELVQRSVEKGEDYSAEYRLRQKDGSVRWIYARGKCHQNEDGTPSRFPGVLVDITDRKAAEARDAFLVRLDDAIRPLTDPHEITQCAARLLGEHLEVNRCAYADVEKDEDTFNLTGDFNKDVPSIVGRYTFTQFGDECLRLMRAGQPYLVEDSETDPRTETVRESYRLTRIRSVICVSLRKQGRFVAAMAVHQTTPRRWMPEEVPIVQQVASRCWESIERAKVARELREREQRYRFLAESIPQMVWTATPDGALDYVNDKGCKYFGEPMETLIGDGWLRWVHPDDSDRVVERWRESLETGKLYETAFRLKRASDGSWRWHLVRALPFFDGDNQIKQWFGTCTDIEDQKATEEQLTRTNRELEEFAFVASHDLQEPLRMVNVYTQLLIRRHVGDEPQAKQYAGIVHQGVRRMEALIHDLLAFSRTIHSSEEAVSGTADLSASLAEAMSVLRDRIQESGATINAPLLPTVQGDTAQVTHVFQNLLSNALKYQHNGTRPEVQIAAQCNGANWTISVKDNGIGFESRYAERIFGLFKRLHKNEYPGTGLGLAICRRIIERHGGRIWAESTPGSGSTFYFSLPRHEGR